MIPNNNLNILPFYDSIEEQNHRKYYAYGEVYTLIAPNNRILPFQINRETSASTISFASVVNLKTNVVTDILQELNNSGLNIKSFASEGYDLIINSGAFLFSSLQLDAGQYFLQISDTTNTWYSDVFTVVSDLSPFLKIEYWDSDNIAYSGGHVDYSSPFKNYCYVQSEIGKPEYPFQETAQERDGHLFIEKQISEKKYKFTFIAPEFLCDALRITRMHDYIKIYSKGKKYDVENIIFDVKWQDQGDIAVVEVEFECDTVIKKIGKGIYSDESSQGDFNNDFNNDFNK